MIIIYYKKFIFALFVLAGVYFLPSHSHADDLASVTVAGFINAGNAKDNNINLMITRSLISLISKVSTNVVPYEKTAGEADQKGFWGEKKLKTALAIDMARDLGTKRVVSGVYMVGADDRMIVRVLVHDVESGAIQFDRIYKGDAGLDIFDTIDNIIRDVTGELIGKPVEIGRLKVTVKRPGTGFKLYVNELFSSDIGVDKPYEDNYLADQIVRVIIRDTNDAEVFNKDVFIEKNFTAEAVYAPKGSIRIRVMDGQALIVIGGTMMGKTATNGDMSVTDVIAEVPQELLVKIKNEETANYTFTLKENEIKSLLVNGSNVTETSEFPLIPVKAGNTNELTNTNAVAETAQETNAAASAEQQPSNRRLIYFPVMGGMMGFLTGTYAMAGIDLYLGAFKIFGSGGTVIYNTAALGFGFIPVANAGLGLNFDITPLFNIALNASALFFFGDTIAIQPEAMLEIGVWQFFLQGGVRYSFTPGAEGISPDFRFGFRF